MKNKAFIKLFRDFKFSCFRDKKSRLHRLLNDCEIRFILLRKALLFFMFIGCYQAVRNYPRAPGQ